MEKLGRAWKRLPRKVRRPIAFIVGALFILGAVATGWLPGPGGIPLFLIGIAILATEFERAQVFRDRTLAVIEHFGQWYRRHKMSGTILCLAGVALAVFISYLLFKRF